MTDETKYVKRAKDNLDAKIRELRKGKAIDPMKRRGRAYGLGERNPDTLPGLYGGYNRSETVQENAEASAYWKSLRKKVQAGSRLFRHLP